MEVWAHSHSNVFKQYHAFTVSTSTMFSFLLSLEQVLNRPNSQRDWTECGWNLILNMEIPSRDTIHMLSIWRFPEIGALPIHCFWEFSTINHPFWGFPISIYIYHSSHIHIQGYPRSISLDIIWPNFAKVHPSLLLLQRCPGNEG